MNLAAVPDYQYPSMNTNSNQMYSWSAICRLVNAQSRSVQVTVFVCRKIGRASIYPDPLNPLINALPYPMPVRVGVSQPGGFPADEIQIEPVNFSGYEILINDGYTIVDNETGRIYRVLQRYPNRPTDIQLDRPWVPGVNIPPSVWVIPPPVTGGRGPCVGVFQKVISF